MQENDDVFSAVQSEIQNAMNLLSNDESWKDNCHRWLCNIMEHKDIVQSAIASLKIPKCFNVYVSITQISKITSNSVVFDLRYRGQNIANLIVDPKNGNVTLDTTKFYKTTSRDFGYPSDSSKTDQNAGAFSVSWNSEKSAEFQRFFKDNPERKHLPGKNNKNEEHRIEAYLLKEFSKLSSHDKQLLNIQPVKFKPSRDSKKNTYFAMSTKIAASNHGDIKIGKGAIDILARTKYGKSYLTVIEVKDENTENEGPREALMQAGAYAAFLQQLLRGPDGDQWWKLFGFNENHNPDIHVPDKLTIRIASAMPRSGDNQRDLIGQCGINACIPIGQTGDDVELHTIFFDDTGDKLENLEATFDKECPKELQHA